MRVTTERWAIDLGRAEAIVEQVSQKTGFVFEDEEISQTIEYTKRKCELNGKDEDYFALEDNEWSLAVELLQRDEGWGDDWRQNLQKRHFQRYLDGIRDSLFEQFESLGAYSGAWTSKTIHRPVEGGEAE